MPPQALRILTLDGAGLKGLSELFILQHLFVRVKELTGLRDIQPCDVFDILAGSSTGGLNAILLGRMVLSTTESILAYTTIGEKVFALPKDDEAHTSKTRRFLRKLASGPQQSRTQDLMESMMGVLSDTRDVAARFSVDDKIQDQEYFDDHSWRVMLSVTRKGRSNDEPEILRNWHSDVPGERNYTLCVWEAAGAVCAEPTWFSETVRLEQSGDRLYAAAKDRANPINDMLEEMHKDKTLTGHDIACLVSIGAGKVQPDGIVSESVSAVAEILSTAEETAENFAGTPTGVELKKAGKYFRFNLPLDAEELAMDECTEVDKVKDEVNKYTNQAAIKEMMEQCAQCLAMTVRISSGRVKGS